MKGLGKSGRNRTRAGPLQNAHPAISNRSRRNRIERAEIEHATRCGTRDVAVANAIWSLKRPAIREAEVTRIVARTRDGREVRTCFPETDRADGPSAKCEFGSTVHVRKEFAILAHGQIVNGGKQKPVAARVCHISAVGRKIEPICNRCTVDDLWIERGGVISPDVAETLCPYVAGLECEAAARVHIQFGL